MDKAMFDKGLKIRKEVLGAEFVEKALASADDFNMPMQELATTYCWGECWGRPGLDKKTRSIINLAMISALNRPHELKIHLRGALNNGVTPDELKELDALLAGMPIWSPLAGPQSIAFESDADIIGYGGAAGGGKSSALLMAALQGVHVPGYAALLLRRKDWALALLGAVEAGTLVAVATPVAASGLLHPAVVLV